MTIFDDFDTPPQPHWTQVASGGGYIHAAGQSVLRLGYDAATSQRYTDAQIDDYTLRSKKEYLWKPPLRMTVRARASHPAASPGNKGAKDTLKGTAGFGFWNRPFTMQGKWFTMPESVWFFYASPHSNMALATDTPGWGWKAQVVHGHKASTLAQAPPLAAAMAYGKVTKDTTAAARWLQRFSGTAEALITQPITDWHTYTLEWLPKTAIFSIDGVEVFRAPFAPTQRLGFAAWIDNAYAVATPQGEVRFGRVKAGKQWLDIDSIKIEPLKA